MTIDDKHIIEAVRSNPESGFRLLLTKYKKPIYWHIRRIVVGHDDAQDAAQETFVRVFRNFSSCDGADKLRGWIFRIATNEALRMLDKRNNTTLSLDDEDTNIAGQAIADPYFDDSDKVIVPQVIRRKRDFFATATSLFTSCITFDSSWSKKLSGTW